MIKAIFIDYTGTIVQENCLAVQEVVMRCYKNSDAKTPQEVLEFWWSNLKKYEEASYLDTFRTEDEIVDILLGECEKEFNLKEDTEELHKLFQQFWMYSPIYDDVKEFFEKCKLPIYVITNNGVQYVQEAMRVNELTPAGIICGDMVRAYKPHKELFEKALEVSGCSAKEVIHIGDSVSSDVKGALSAGIAPVYLDRAGENNQTEVRTVQSLLELLDK